MPKLSPLSSPPHPSHIDASSQRRSSSSSTTDAQLNDEGQRKDNGRTEPQ